MDLIVRYRDATITHVDSVLVAGIEGGRTYKVVGKVQWDVAHPGPTRDRLDIWVDPTSGEEPQSSDFSSLGMIGDRGSFKALHLLQKQFGADSSEAVYMDEARLASSWAELVSTE